MDLETALLSDEALSIAVEFVICLLFASDMAGFDFGVEIEEFEVIEKDFIVGPSLEPLRTRTRIRIRYVVGVLGTEFEIVKNENEIVS